MLRRIVRSLVTFVGLVAAYQAYVLLAVPLMEPALAARRGESISKKDRDDSERSVTRYQLLLSNYFPRDHWTQTQPPKVIMSSNEQAMLVIDEFTRNTEERGGDVRATRVDINNFALLVFPTPPREGITPPRDAIILETSEKSFLLFDDFRPEQGKIGRITRGHFPGRITIRSDMHEEGPEDDLLIETADLEMNTRLLYTMSPVRFRMGRNIGGGRELEIRFLSDEHVRTNDTGLKIAGIDSLEIRREVRMRLELETAGLLPGSEKTSSSESSPKGKGDNEPKPPVEVTCSGPFTFDFVRYVASLDRDVDLRQINPNGPSDQLVCGQLDIHFAPKLEEGAAANRIAPDPTERQQHDLGRLEPVAIVAEGHPALVTSPSRGAQARGDRILVRLREQRVGIGGGGDAMLTYGPNVLRAPAIEYEHPAGEATTLGRFRATGPGSLHYVPDAAKPDEVMQASWQTSVALDRENGQPVLMLDGRPRIAFGELGSLVADEITMHLRELEGGAAPGVGISLGSTSDGGSKLHVVPDRLTARGGVEIQSAQLTGRTSELSATFSLLSAEGEDAASDGAGGTSGQSAGEPTRFGIPGGDSQQSFHIDSDTMRIEVKVQGGTVVPKTIFCDGNIAFREIPRAVTNHQPLVVRGSHLTVDRLEDGAAHVTLRGAADGATGAALAQVSGRGVTMQVDALEINTRDNRMWSDGTGKATLLVTRDLQGQAAATPFAVEILWQGGLDFDGQRVVFERDVLVAGAEDMLRCDRLTATLSQNIEFGDSIDQRSIEVAEVDCQGRVRLDHRTRDGEGLTSHERVELECLTINQQTGVVRGEGPGVIRSTRYGPGLGALAAGGGAAVPVNSAGAKLNFLRVDFRQGLSGNLYIKELTFSNRIRAVYGPVDSWEQELNVVQPEMLPPDAMMLTCDELRVNEDPVAARALAAQAGGAERPLGPIQLQADGNVQINGQVPTHGAFTALAARASYEQAKDRFVLEGDGRSSARLWRAGQHSAPPEAQRISFIRSTNEIKVDGIQFFEILPSDLKDLQNARRPQEVR